MAHHASPSPVLTPLAHTPGIGTYSLKLWDERPKAYSRHIFRHVCVFLYAVLMFDGIASFGLNQALKNFFIRLGWSNVGSNAMKATYDSIAQFACIFSSYAADEHFGKFKTIFGSASIDLVGFTMIVVASLPSVLQNVGVAKVLFTVGLFVFIAPTHSAMNSLTVAYGGDQFSPAPSDEKKKALYFSFVLFTVSLGASISYSIFPFIALNGIGAIPPAYGYTANFSFGLICVVLMVSILTFTRKRYVNLPPTKHSVSQVIKVMVSLAQRSWHARGIVVATVLYIVAFLLNIIAALLSDDGTTGFTVSKVAGGLVVISTVTWVYIGRRQSFVEAAKESYGGKFDDEFVDGVKKIVRVLPLYAFNVIWWMCQNQRGNNQTIIQQTDLRIGNSPTAKQIPGPVVQIANPLATMVFVPLTVKVIYPWYEKVMGKPPSRYGKIVTGYGVAALSMFWSGCFEMIRRSRPLLTYIAADSSTRFIYNKGGLQPMSDIPWFAALPQYFLNALAGVLIFIPSYDLCYNEVPQSMSATSLALNAFSGSMGSTLLSAVVILWRDYIPANLNRGHMEYMYFTLCGIMLVNIVFFVIVMNQTKLGMHSDTSSNTANKTTADDSEAVEKQLVGRAYEFKADT